MTAKEYLNRVRRQNYILKQTEKELNEIRADILTLRASSLSEHVSGSKILTRLINISGLNRIWRR